MSSHSKRKQKNKTFFTCATITQLCSNSGLTLEESLWSEKVRMTGTGWIQINESTTNSNFFRVNLITWIIESTACQLENPLETFSCSTTSSASQFSSSSLSVSLWSIHYIELKIFSNSEMKKFSLFREHPQIMSQYVSDSWSPQPLLFVTEIPLNSLGRANDATAPYPFAT